MYEPLRGVKKKTREKKADKKPWEKYRNPDRVYGLYWQLNWQRKIQNFAGKNFDRMWRKAIFSYASSGLRQPWCRSMVTRRSSSISSTVNSILLLSLKDHYLEVSKMTPPPVIILLSFLFLSLPLHFFFFCRYFSSHFGGLVWDCVFAAVFIFLKK